MALTITYYMVTFLLTLLLGSLASAAAWPGFPQWLTQHPRLMLALLGINLLPPDPVKTLRRFYWFLAGGWAWILVWTWWVMPSLREYFFSTAHSGQTMEMARWSTQLIMGAYAAVGFFAIGRSLIIWYREIYNRADRP
jgi:hypothetical protein